MINSTSITIGLICTVTTLVASMLGYSGYQDLKRIDAAYLTLESLKYENGEFIQDVRVRGRDAIRGDWAAKITRNNRVICSGGGTSVYAGKVVMMPPDVWVGGDCPEIQPGDEASATWEWEDEHGLRRGVSGILKIE